MVMSSSFARSHFGLLGLAGLAHSLSAIVFQDCIQIFRLNFYSLAEFVLHLIGVLLRQGHVRLQSFLRVAKCLVVGKIEQDGFRVGYQKKNMVFRAPNKACSRLGVRAAFFEPFRGLEFFPFRRRVHPPTPSG